jgi:ABC-type nitrate/sulfonate/bicarbonate transport system substrate-binding protein
MLDSAPLIVAHEMGCFARHGVKVTLTREAGWAGIRERLLHAEIDGAQMHASMAFAIHCGIGGVARTSLTGLVLHSSGSAITLSNELWELGVRDAPSLRQAMEARRGARKFVFAHDCALSPHHHILRHWLRSGGIDPERDLRLVVVPPPLLLHALLDGFIDGYCTGEPWSSLALATGKTWSPPACADQPGAQDAENVFLVLHKFAQQHPDEHLAMLTALIEACHHCDRPENRPAIIRLLARKEYLDVPASALANCLSESAGAGRPIRTPKDAGASERHNANAPTRERGRSIYKQIARNGLARNCPAFRRDATRRIFREDLYQQALANTLLPNPFPPTPIASLRRTGTTKLPSTHDVALRV